MNLINVLTSQDMDSQVRNQLPIEIVGDEDTEDTIIRKGEWSLRFLYYVC